MGLMIVLAVAGLLSGAISAVPASPTRDPSAPGPHRTTPRCSSLGVNPNVRPTHPVAPTVDTPLGVCRALGTPTSKGPSVRHLTTLGSRAASKAKQQYTSATGIHLDDAPATCGAVNGWEYDRFQACAIRLLDWDLVNLNTGEVIGGLETALITIDLSYDLTEALEHYSLLQVQSLWGYGSDAWVMSYIGTCTVYCTGGAYEPVPFPVAYDTEFESPDIYWGTAGLGQIGYAHMLSDFNPINATAGSNDNDWVVDDSPRFRCDDVLEEDDQPPGCIDASSDLPTFYIPTIQYPNIAAHTAAAQGSGLPGSRLSGTYLTRMRNKTAIRANRDRACRSSYYRAPGTQCDEYPYASTYEGAAAKNSDMSYKGPVRTFPKCYIPQLAALTITAIHGASACMVPTTENQAQSNALRGFYNQQRILDGNGFWVQVQGTRYKPRLVVGCTANEPVL